MPTPASATQTQEQAMDAFGQRVAKRLNKGIDEVHPDISARLRFAREQALLARRGPAMEVAPAVHQVVVSNALALAGGGQHHERDSGNLGKMRGFFIMFVFVAMLAAFFSLEQSISHELEQELVELDTQLLVDALPPSAYTDPGFTQYLRNQEKD